MLLLCFVYMSVCMFLLCFVHMSVCMFLLCFAYMFVFVCMFLRGCVYVCMYASALFCIYVCMYASSLFCVYTFVYARVGWKCIGRGLLSACCIYLCIFLCIFHHKSKKRIYQGTSISIISYIYLSLMYTATFTLKPRCADIVCQKWSIKYGKNKCTYYSHC